MHYISRNFSRNIFIVLALLIVSSCTTQKRKDDVSGLGMLYQNMTAHYNGYFNATEIYKESILSLEDQYQDNYSKLLPVYKYTAVPDPKSVSGELDNVIKKASVVVSLHRPSKWTDDCYLIIGQAQFVKQDYESAQKTLEYMVNNFDPANPRKNVSKSSKSGAKSKREKAKEIKEKHDKAEQARKEAEQTRKESEKERKKYNKAKKKKKKRPSYKKRKKKKSKKRRPSSKKRKKNAPKLKAKPDDTEKKVEEKETPKTETSVKKQEPKETKSEIEKEKKKKEDKSKKNADELNPKDPQKDGMFAHKPSHKFGLLWLARTYVQRDFLTQAGMMMDRVEKSDHVTDEILGELYPAKADFYIYSGNFSKAAEALVQAIEYTKSRSLRGRYAFIIGQLYGMQDNHSGAVEYFNKASKWCIDYEMAFNADLNARMQKMQSGATTQNSIVKELEKMLKDDKNTEFHDRIYFQIAKVYMESGDEAQAAEYLKKALDAPSSNPAQKVEIYLELADIHYKKDEFSEAYEYYSLAVGSMSTENVDYRRLEERTQSLKPIAAHLDKLHLQDSLLGLSKKSPEELDALAKDIIAMRKKKAEEEQAKMEKAKSQAMATSVNFRNPLATTGNNSSKFFAYNEKELRKGFRDFQRTWGSRMLADNWRVSSAGSAVATNDNRTLGETMGTTVPTQQEVEDVFKNVPRDSVSLLNVKDQIADALFSLGIAFRNNLERYDLSDESFERYVNEFGDKENVPEVYYYLMLNAKVQNNNTQAEYYRNILLTNYAETKFGLIANDPAYLEELIAEEGSLERFYAKTYDDFNEARYDDVIAAFGVSKSKFGTDHEYLSKFALLRAMSFGQSGGKEKYIDELRTVVAQYPNTAEQVKAREIIRFLSGDEDAFEKNWDFSMEVTNYKSDFDKQHYIIVILQNSDIVSVNDFKAAISDYNRNFHKLENLSVRSFVLDRKDKTPAILIRKFNDKDAAMKYFNTVQGRKSEFAPKLADFDLFAISQSNYRELIKVGNATSYLQFFNDNYTN